MSFGALSAPAKEALGRGATEVGTSTTTGDGGMTQEEREHSKILVYQLLPSRYGMNPDDLRRADAIEVVVGQGAKPGGGGMLLGHKISDRVAEMRDLPKGIDQRSASRHPDWTGPDDLEIKIGELREITDWEKPIFVKVGATRTYYDVQLAVKAGADVIVVDGMQGGTAATQDVFIEHVGIPTLPAVRLAVDALQELGMHRRVQLIVSGGIRTGADVAKALALGADAVSIGTAALIAMGDNAPEHDEAYRRIGSAVRLLRRLAGRPRPGGDLDPGGRARRPLRSRARRPADRQLPARAHARGADPRARVREVPRPQPRAGRPRRADRGGGGHGARPAGGHELDPGPEGGLMLLYDSDVSGNCYKVRLLLAQLGLEYERYPLDVVDRSNRHEVLGDLNPGCACRRSCSTTSGRWASRARFSGTSGTAPSTCRPTRSTGPRSSSGCSSSSTATSRTSRCPASGSRRESPSSPETLAERQRIGYLALDAMESHLAGHEFLVGERYSIADIALYAYTHVAHEGGFDLAGYAGDPRLARPGRRPAGPRPDRRLIHTRVHERHGRGLTPGMSATAVAGKAVRRHAPRSETLAWSRIQPGLAGTGPARA